MKSKSFPVHTCPERFSETCRSKVSQCFSDRDDLRADQIVRAEEARDSLISAGQGMIDLRSGWANTEALMSLEGIFRGLAEERYQEMMSQVPNVACRGVGVVLRRCSAELTP